MGTAATVETRYSRVIPPTTPCFIFGSTSTIYVDRGAHGRGKDRKGKNGEDEVLKVPLGTQVFRREPDGSRTLLADICDDTPVLIAQGGLGGWGNARYVSATNQEPVLAQRGGAGERATLFLELKLLADVALVARPNAGKSTLVSRTTGASPRIADYPFTTVEPVLGVVYTRGKEFVLMEIPGLLEGGPPGYRVGAPVPASCRTREVVYTSSGRTFRGPVGRLGHGQRGASTV